VQISHNPPQDMNPRSGIHQGVIIKNDYGQNLNRENFSPLQNIMEFQPQDSHGHSKSIFMTSNVSQFGAAPVTLQQRKNSGNESEIKTISTSTSDTHVKIPFDQISVICSFKVSNVVML